jgi:hypothetical protein
MSQRLKHSTIMSNTSPKIVEKLVELVTLSWIGILALHIGLRPLELTGIPLELQDVLLALARAEPEYSPVPPHEVDPCSGGNIMPAEAAL